MLSAGTPKIYPTENAFGGGPKIYPTENAFGGERDAL